MSSVQISVQKGLPSVSTDGDSIYVWGTPVLDETFLTERDCYDRIRDIDSFDEFCELQNELNGFYSIVYHDSRRNRLFAGVDRVRSVPIFYGTSNETIFLSDDAWWIREQVGAHHRSSAAEVEFLRAAIVSGPSTFYPSVKQLQAGEALTADPSTTGSGVRTERYFRFRHSESTAMSKRQLLGELDDVYSDVFTRLIEFADGRTIVIPLSGGYDSRVIAIQLSRLGYDDVLAYSYGKPGNEDATVAADVADNLDIPWEFVPYSTDKWNDWFHSEEMDEYYEFCENYCTNPPIQEWPAVRELARSDRFPDEAVFVPGHSGIVMGGLLTDRFEGFDDPTVEDVAELLWTDHYQLNAVGEKEECLETIRETISDESIGTYEDAASAYIEWCWQERHAKRMVNSMRTYEFWGYDWWLPLWDKRHVEFWSAVPYEFWVNKRLFSEYVERQYRDVAAVDPAEAATEAGKGRIFSVVEGLIEDTVFHPPLSKLYNRMFRGYDDNQMGWYGIMDEEVFEKHYTGNENINSFKSLEKLGLIDFRETDGARSERDR